MNFKTPDRDGSHFEGSLFKSAGGGSEGHREARSPGRFPTRFLALCLLSAALFLSACAAQAPRTAGSALPFNGSGADALVALRVSFLMDTLVLARDASGQWVVGGRRVPVDTAKLSGSLAGIFGLNAAEPVGALAKVSAELAERFDLTEARIVEAKFRGGRTVRLVLAGPLTGDYSSTYWKLESGREVYRVPGNAIWGIPLQESWWFERNLFPEFGPVRVRRVEARWVDSAGAAHDYRLRRPSPSKTYLDDPEPIEVHRDHAGEVITQTSVLILDSVPPAADTAALARGLAAPVLDLTFTLDDESIHTLSAGRDRGGLHAIRHPVTGRIVLIRNWRLKPFFVTRAVLRMGPYHGPWQDDGTSMDYPGVGVLIPNYHFHKDYTGGAEHDHDQDRPDDHTGQEGPERPEAADHEGHDHHDGHDH